MNFFTDRRNQLRGSELLLAFAFNTAERVRFASLSSQDIANWWMTKTRQIPREPQN